MYRRPSKKQLLIQRVVASIISVVAVLVIVTGTILFVLGFRLNSDNSLEQGALVQFESVPAAADISIDSRPLGVRTPNKQSVLAGTHSFIVSRDGYQPWAKSVTLKAGTLTWLDYIRLVPKDLIPETVVAYSSLYGEKASPDLGSLLIQEKSDVPTFQLVDLRAQEVKISAITLPAAVYSAVADGSHRFTMHQWDTGGRYLLLQHEYTGKKEWIVVDTQNVASSINITRALNISVSNLQFAGTSGTVLFGLQDDGTVRKLDLSAGTISRALITNVSQFDVFNLTIIAYVGTDPDNASQKVAGLYRDGDQSPHILRTATSVDTPLLIDTTRYRSDDYVAIAEGSEVTILRGSYPASSDKGTDSLQAFGSFAAQGPINQLSFSEDGDFLVAQSGVNFVGYELEHERATSASIPPLADGSAPSVLKWLDNAYLWSDRGNTLVIREFDGTNSHTIGEVAEGFDVTLSRNGRYLYSMAKTDAGYQLQRVKMILD